MTSTKLKPEFKHALASIDNVLPRLPAVPLSSVSCAIWTHDKFSLFDQPLRVRRIPAGKDWRWNQTKCKKHATLTSCNASVIFAKLVPRRTNKSETPLPNYKLWYFQIEPEGATGGMTAFWCERGSPDPQRELDGGLLWAFPSSANGISLSAVPPPSEVCSTVFSTLAWSWETEYPQTEAERPSRAEAYNLQYICNC